MAEKNNVTESIRDYFDSQNWKYRYDEDKGLFRMFMHIRVDDVDACEVRTIVRDERRFTTFVTFPFRVPEKKRAIAASFISRANYKLLLGCFEMDYRDGEIRFRMCVDCEDCMPSQTVVKNSILIPMAMYRNYGDALLTVLFGIKTAEEALKGLED